MKRILISLITLLMILPGVTGQTTVKKQYKAERLTIAPTIDGILDDNVWEEGTWTDDTRFRCSCRRYLP